jgi:hypothetical protein
MGFKHFTIVIFFSVLIACSGKKQDAEHSHTTPEAKGETQADTVKKSIPKEEHAQIGAAHAMIKYHAPAVRGRTIWGGLVPYGEVWVTGAHSATTFEIDRTIVIDNKEVVAGKYALFTIPDKDKWTIIINRNWDQHLADEYDQKDDVLRVTVTPEIINNIQERLKYSVTAKDDNNGAVMIRWEYVKVSLPFEVKK